MMHELLQLFSPKMKETLEQYIEDREHRLEEIRLRMNKPIELNFFDGHIFLHSLIFTKEERMYFLRQLTNHSIYRMQEPFQLGFLTVKGGHRIGFSGEVLAAERRIKEATFFNIRIAREAIGVARPLMSALMEDGQLQHTLLFGAPQSGKTTMLRDIAKQLDERYGTYKIALIDERSEIAASENGVPQLDIGSRTDVMDNCLKQFGMFMMIRSMSPHVLIVDEIGSEEDVQAMLEAIRTGVTIICTAHSDHIKELIRRPQLKMLFEDKVFKRIVHVKRNENGCFRLITMNDHYKQLHAYEVPRK